MNSKKHQALYTFLFIWLVINVIQSLYTTIGDDEAYYWYYAQHMDWGFFDHPPMIGVMTWIGEAIFGKTEIGVRFMTILMSLGSIILAYFMIKPKQPWLFLLFISSILMVQIGGFYTAPDVPLVFFTCLFYYILVKYIEKDSILHALLLGFAMSMMAYSKYTGALNVLLAFVLLPKLWTKKTFYISIVVAAGLYFPHLLWQYNHDFVSFRFHLVDRNTSEWMWTFPLDYIGGQLAIWGPFTSLFIIYGFTQFKKVKTGNIVVGKMFFWTTIIVFTLLLANSFRGHIEANWTAALLLPILYVGWKGIEAGYLYREGNLHIPRLLKITIGISILLIILLRIQLLTGWSTSIQKVRPEFANYERWAEQLQNRFGDTTLVFFDRYQEPSKYQFLTDGKAVSFTTAPDPGTLDDYLTEKVLNYTDQPVVLFHSDVSGDKRFVVDGVEKGIIHEREYEVYPVFKYYNHIQFNWENPIEHLVSQENIEVCFKVTSMADRETLFDSQELWPTEFGAYLYRPGSPHEFVAVQEDWDIDKINGDEKLQKCFTISFPDLEGEYALRWSIKTQFIHGHNSKKYKVEFSDSKN